MEDTTTTSNILHTYNNNNNSSMMQNMTRSSSESSCRSNTQQHHPHSNILFRHVCPTDLPKIYNLERLSYPKDEAASKSQIQYRQHHAAPFFRCAVSIPSSHDDNNTSGTGADSDGYHSLNNSASASASASANANAAASPRSSHESNGGDESIESNESMIRNSNNSNNNTTITNTNEHIIQEYASTSALDLSRNSLNEIGTIIGFITATRCTSFTEESMKTHDPNGTLLAIHSVVIENQFRNLGIGQAMVKNYIKVVEEMMQAKIDCIKTASSSSSSGGGISIKKSSSGSNLQQTQQHMQNQYHSTRQSPPQKKNWNLISKIVLMSKIQNIPFYIKCGFQVIGKSPIVHGQDEWYDCIKPLENVQEFMKEKDDLYEERLRRFQFAQMQMELEKVMINERIMNSKYDYSGSDGGMPCWTVDSFAIPNNNFTPTSTAIRTYVKGSGNPAGVVMIPSNLTLSANNQQLFNPNSTYNIEWMQTVAKEFNLSETAFIWEKSKVDDNNDDGNNDNLEYFIRYFTCNGSEVDLCGHATLAASSVIFQKLKNGNGSPNSASPSTPTLAKNDETNNEIIFYAKHNVILKAKEQATTTSMNNSVTSSSTSSSSVARSIIMEFPTKQVIEFTKGSKSYTNIMTMIKQSFFSSSSSTSSTNQSPSTPNDPDATLINMDKDVIFVGVDDANDDLFIELSPDAFERIPSDTNQINFKPMNSVDEYNRGVIISCLATTDVSMSKSTAPVDFISRFFGPKVGIDEDPVTGSAHCVLGPYYSSKLGIKDVLVGYQKSLRGGLVECRLFHNEEGGMILIAGTAVTAMRGTLFM